MTRELIPVHGWDRLTDGELLAEAKRCEDALEYQLERYAESGSWAEYGYYSARLTTITAVLERRAEYVA